MKKLHCNTLILSVLERGSVTHHHL